MIEVAPSLHPYAGQDPVSLLESRVARAGDKPALVWQPFDGPTRQWTYAQFLAEVRRVAAGLSDRGVTARDRVLLHSENCPEFLFTWFACSWIGAVCVVVNPKAAGPELAYYSGHTGAVGAVTHAAGVDLLSAHCRSLRWVVVISHEGTGSLADRQQPEASHAFATLGGRREAVRAALDPVAPVCMMFTSGTTSRPKAVVYSRGNALWAARSGAANAGLAASDVVLSFLPLYHAVGLAWTVLPAFWAGATVVLQPRFSASRFWPLAAACSATIAAHVQFSSGVLARQEVPRSHGFRLWCNSTWLPEYVQRFGLPIIGWWGMTETVAPGIVGDGVLSQTPGSIGRAAPGYEIALVDDDDRRVEPGQCGQLLLRGARGLSIFQEYFADAAATEAAFAPGGWFRTGDRMRAHPDGSIQFVERARDVIKTGGEGVSPAEIERVIRGVEGVREVAVVGRPDTNYGEVGVAFVVTSEQTRADAHAARRLCDAVMERCRAELSGFKVPREVRLLDTLPLAGLAKIAKGRLREMALTDPARDPNSGA